MQLKPTLELRNYWRNNMDAPGSNGPTQLGAELKATYAKSPKKKKFSKISNMLGK